MNIDYTPLKNFTVARGVSPGVKAYSIALSVMENPDTAHTPSPYYVIIEISPNAYFVVQHIPQDDDLSVFMSTDDDDFAVVNSVLGYGAEIIDISDPAFNEPALKLCIDSIKFDLLEQMLGVDCEVHNV